MLEAWSEARISGQYLVYTHIFLPSFVHIIPIIQAGRFAALVKFEFSLLNTVKVILVTCTVMPVLRVSLLYAT